MRKFKNKLSLILAFAMVLTLMVGALAYFTDRVTTDATISTLADGIIINPDPDPNVDPDDPSKPPFVDPTPDDPSDDITNWWAYLNSKAIVNFNPGDKMTLNYTLKNEGSLAVDVRETFIVTSTKPLSASPEFRLHSAFTKDAAGANIGGAVVVTEERIDDTHYKYTIAPYTLSSDDETIGTQPTDIERDYYLVFSALAGNAFQGAKVSVDYVVEVKQHSDGGNADWVTAATGSLTVGGQNLNVVPAN